MNTILYALAVIPGLKEVLLVSILFFILKKINKTPWPKTLTLATLYSSIFLGILYFVISLGDHNRFLLLPFIYFTMAIAAYICLRHPLLQKISFLVAMTLLIVLNWQFTFVHQTATTKAQWKTGEKTKVENGYDGQTVVEVIYGCGRHGIVSAELADYLKTKQAPEVELVIRPMYHYGKLAGYNIESIDGRHFSSSNSWSSHNCTDSDPKLYPDYYLGLRGFTFSQMYPGWKP